MCWSAFFLRFFRTFFVVFLCLLGFLPSRSCARCSRLFFGAFFPSFAHLTMSCCLLLHFQSFSLLPFILCLVLFVNFRKKLLKIFIGHYRIFLLYALSHSVSLFQMETIFFVAVHLVWSIFLVFPLLFFVVVQRWKSDADDEHQSPTRINSTEAPSPLAHLTTTRLRCDTLFALCPHCNGDRTDQNLANIPIQLFFLLSNPIALRFVRIH